MPQHETLAAALAAFAADLPKLTKDQEAKVQGETQDGRRINYSYGYADLAQVTEAVSPALGKHGLAFTAFPTVHENGAFILAYSLTHESGEERSGIWPLPDPVRTKPQQLGSAITYARRYAFMAVTNTFPGGEDDDGAAAAPAAHREDRQQHRQARDERPANTPASPTPQQQPRTYSADEVVDMHGKIDTLELEKAGALYDWMAARNLHNRPIDFGEGHPPVTATTRLAVRLGHIAADDTTTVENLSWLHNFADGRGLLKTPVSPNSNLGDRLVAEKGRRTRAAVDASPVAQETRAAAAASWDEQPPAAIVYTGADADGAYDPESSEAAAAAQARDAAAMAAGVQ